MKNPAEITSKELEAPIKVEFVSQMPNSNDDVAFTSYHYRVRVNTTNNKLTIEATSENQPMGEEERPADRITIDMPGYEELIANTTILAGFHTKGECYLIIPPGAELDELNLKQALTSFYEEEIKDKVDKACTDNLNDNAEIIPTPKQTLQSNVLASTKEKLFSLPQQETLDLFVKTGVLDANHSEKERIPSLLKKLNIASSFEGASEITLQKYWQ